MKTFPHPSIVTIDCQYMLPRKGAAYLIHGNGRAAFVDNNTMHAVPHLLGALRESGLRPEQVDYLIITHVHPDHAGGTGTLLKHCPNATVLAHPRAARHVIDPGRLIESARMVYGEEGFRQVIGGMEPVAESRVRVMEDGESLAWAGRTLRFIYTEGHARHHFCIHDSETNAIFTGDAFGLGMSAHTRPGAPFVVCSSTPIDFDAAAARKAATDIPATGARHAYLGHYGVVEDLDLAAEHLLRSIDHMEAILEEAVNRDECGEALQRFCETRVGAAFDTQLRACDVADFEADRQWLEGDVVLNAMGLAYVAGRRRKTSASG